MHLGSAQWSCAVHWGNIMLCVGDIISAYGGGGGVSALMVYDQCIGDKS